jgi:hypothetical protein
MVLLWAAASMDSLLYSLCSALPCHFLWPESRRHILNISIVSVQKVNVVSTLVACFVEESMMAT